MDKKQSDLIRKISQKCNIPEEKVKAAFLKADGDPNKAMEILEQQAGGPKNVWIPDAGRRPACGSSFLEVERIVNSIITIIAIIVVLHFARGPDGFICRHIYPSAYTETEKGLWRALAGCDCRQIIISSSNEDINSQLIVAAGLGKVEDVRELIKKGADVNAGGPATDQVPAGCTALMLAAARNQQDVVRLLLSSGANPNQADEGGGTALIYASWKGHLDIVRILLEAGADVNATTRDGRTSIIVAKSSGHEEVAKLLKSYGAQK